MDFPWREEEELVCASLLSGVLELFGRPLVLALVGADLVCLVTLSPSLVSSWPPTISCFLVSDTLFRPEHILLFIDLSCRESE